MINLSNWRNRFRRNRIAAIHRIIVNYNFYQFFNLEEDNEVKRDWVIKKKDKEIQNLKEVRLFLEFISLILVNQ